MKSNFEYIKEFVEKHNYDKHVHVQCFKTVDLDSVKTVVFNEVDIPSKKPINLDDIKYDIDSDLPEDVFYRWLEYCDKHKDSDVTYIYWMTKMDNHYEPMGIDKSESEKVKNLIYSKLEEMRQMRWF